MSQLVSKIGVLRLLLGLLTIILAILALFAGSQAQHHGWRMIPSMLAPAIVPVLFFVYPLDMTMSAVIMSGADEAEKQRQRYILRVDTLLLIILTLAWLPFFLRILRLA